MSIKLVKHALPLESRHLNHESSTLDGMNDVSDRIRILRKELGLTQHELGKAAGVTKSAVSQWEKGSSIPGRDALLSLQNTFRINPDWVITGQGPMRASEGEATAELPAVRVSGQGNVSEAPAQVGRPVPLISWVQAGDWSEAVDHLQPGDAEEWLPSPVRVGPHAFALRVEGDSMTSPYPGRSYPPGTIIYVDPDIAPTPGKPVVAKLTDTNEVTFKIYVEEASGKKYLRPLNPQYPVIEIDANCEIVGVVVGSWHPE